MVLNKYKKKTFNKNRLSMLPLTASQVDRLSGRVGSDGSFYVCVCAGLCNSVGTLSPALSPFECKFKIRLGNGISTCTGLSVIGVPSLFVCSHFAEKRATEGSGLVSHYEQKRKISDSDSMSDKQADTVYGKYSPFARCPLSRIMMAGGMLSGQI